MIWAAFEALAYELKLFLTVDEDCQRIALADA